MPKKPFAIWTIVPNCISKEKTSTRFDYLTATMQV